MRSKGSRFTLGVWGLRVCSLDVAQPSATVRNRPREGHSGAYGKFCGLRKGAFLEVSNVALLPFRVAGVALRYIQTFFVTRRKSFCVEGAILLRPFHKMSCTFCDRRNTLDVSSVILRGRRSTSDVSCCVFFGESNCQVCVKWRQGPTRCKFRAGVAFCEM